LLAVQARLRTESEAVKMDADELARFGQIKFGANENANTKGSAG
jgi:hypothetical protein